MKRVPVFTLASLVVLGLLAAPVTSATLYGTDTPDIRLAPGASADQVFDLNDFFDSASGDISYMQDGQALSSSVVDLAGSADAGMTTVQFEASAGGETVSQDSVVQVSSFMIDNVPAIENNLAGVDGNAFLNGIAPGSSMSSVQALALVGGGDFGSLTGGSATGAAGLIATIAEVNTSYTDTGLVVRNAEVKASGAGSASFGGLTASLDASGSYTLEAAGDFGGPFVVTLGAAGGASADAVHIVAANETEIPMEDGAFAVLAPTGLDAGSFSGGTATVGAGQGVLVIANTGVEMSGEATVSLNYQSDSASVSVAVVAFDAASVAALNPELIAYELVAGGLVEVDTLANISTSNMVSTGVLPAFQVVNTGDAAASVTISDLSVMQVGPVQDFAINPNATADLGVNGDLAGVSLPTVNNQAAGAAAGENNFASANGDGCYQLDASSAVTNGLIQATVDDGLFAAECWIQKVGGEGTFYLHATDGAAEARQQVDVAAMGSGWQKVSAEGLANADSLFVVVQTSEANVYVDDVSVRLVQDDASFFDYELLGL
ncbi:hypothetical protein GF373_02175 [bacterium]|nr:hypothetical protein [bacterium]